MSDTNKADCCCLALDLCLDSPSRTAKFGKEYIADGGAIEKMVYILDLN